MTNTLWEPDEIAGWVQWTPHPGRTRMDNRQYTRSNITSHQRPETGVIATVSWGTASAELLSKGTVEVGGPETTEVQDWTRQYLHLPDDQGKHFATALQQRTAKTTGDGSWKYGHSVGGFMSFDVNDDEDIKPRFFWR